MRADPFQGARRREGEGARRLAGREAEEVVGRRLCGGGAPAILAEAPRRGTEMPAALDLLAGEIRKQALSSSLVLCRLDVLLSVMVSETPFSTKTH